MHVFYIEAGIVERVGHLALTVHALVAHDGGLDACGAVLEALDAQAGSLSGPALRQTPAQRLLLVVLKASLGLLVATLVAVEQVAALVPHVAQVIDEEHVLLAVAR